LPARLEFVRALAVELPRYRGPRHAEGRQLVRLCKPCRSLAEQAESGDQLAEGLAAATLRAIEAAAERLHLGNG